MIIIYRQHFRIQSLQANNAANNGSSFIRTPGLIGIEIDMPICCTYYDSSSSEKKSVAIFCVTQ